MLRIITYIDYDQTNVIYFEYKQQLSDVNFEFDIIL